MSSIVSRGELLWTSHHTSQPNFHFREDKDAQTRVKRADRAETVEVRYNDRSLTATRSLGSSGESRRQAQESLAYPETMYGELWLKRVLIPFWTVKLVFVLILVISLSLDLALLSNRGHLGDGDASYPDLSDKTYERVFRAARISAAVWLAICCVTIILEVVEVVLYARKRLSPVVAVVVNSIVAIVWGALFILLWVGIARSRTGLGLIWIIVVFAACLGKLIYASVILHRFRQRRSATRGAYTPAPAEAPAGLDGSYSAYDVELAGAGHLAAAPPNPIRSVAGGRWQDPTSGVGVGVR